MDDHGVMNSEAGSYAGLDRFACRKQIVADLQEQGFLDKIEDYQHAVGKCYRCSTVVEPTTSKQWFVSVRPLADKAVAAVQEGRIKLYPNTWYRTFYAWMENIRDWCISRQIWWGHRIPAWTCEGCGQLVVEVSAPDACPFCGSTTLHQENDVLDTWFSSALWPFSTLGWPENTKELATFYPTSVLITSFDILFFWVARMMMMGLHFMDEVPFHDVYLHALVRDKFGKKMSKSTGNVIDPLVMIGQYGTDAFRFTLTAFAAQGREIRMDEERIDGYRRFINKLWNAARFAQMHLKEADPAITALAADPKKLALAHRWILSRINGTIAEVRAALDGYNFNEVASASYQFVWHEFCDWYLEWIKADLFSDDATARDQAKAVLLTVLEQVLKLMHPICPFVTEEIWSQLPGERRTIMLEPFPEVNPAWGGCGGRDSDEPAHGSDLRSAHHPYRGRGPPQRQDRGPAHLSGCGQASAAHRLCPWHPGHGPGQRADHRHRSHGARRCRSRSGAGCRTGGAAQGVDRCGRRTGQAGQGEG
jgi:Valyl-tRNA synthetase